MSELWNRDAEYSINPYPAELIIRFKLEAGFFFTRVGFLGSGINFQH